MDRAKCHPNYQDSHNGKAEKMTLEEIRNGGDRVTECQNGTRLTLEKIAPQFGTSKRDLQRLFSY